MNKLIRPILIRYATLLGLVGTPVLMYQGIRHITEGITHNHNGVTVTHWDGLSRVTYRLGTDEDVMLIDNPLKASVNIFDHDKDGQFDSVSDNFSTYSRSADGEFENGVSLVEIAERDWCEYREAINRQYPELGLISGDE